MHMCTSTCRDDLELSTAEVNDYIKRMVQAGFGKESVRNGSDDLAKVMETSIGVIENATTCHLTRRGYLFNNAVRFFRLDESKYK